jgi:hypothetical protein
MPKQSSFVFVFTQRIGEQSARVGSPGCFWIAQPLERHRVGVEAFDRSGQGCTASRRVDVSG